MSDIFIPGEKPFPCTFEGCDKKFPNSSDRKKHLLTHYKGKVLYVCQVPDCHKAYLHNSSLKKHTKANHSPEEPSSPPRSVTPESEPLNSLRSETPDSGTDSPLSVDPTDSGWTHTQVKGDEILRNDYPNLDSANSDAQDTGIKNNQATIASKPGKEEEQSLKDHMRLPVIPTEYPGITSPVHYEEWYACLS